MIEHAAVGRFALRLVEEFVKERVDHLAREEDAHRRAGITKFLLIDQAVTVGVPLVEQIGDARRLLREVRAALPKRRLHRLLLPDVGWTGSPSIVELTDHKKSMQVSICNRLTADETVVRAQDAAQVMSDVRMCLRCGLAGLRLISMWCSERRQASSHGVDALNMSDALLPEPTLPISSIQSAVSTAASLSILTSSFILILPLVASGPSHTFQYVIIAVLSGFNLIESITYAIGPALGHDATENPSAGCVVQGVAMQFASMASFSWILLFCYSLFASTRPGTRDLLSRRATLKNVLPALCLVILVALITCFCLGSHYGDAKLWCWVKDPGMGLAFYYAPLTLIWVCAIGCVIYSLRQLISRPLGASPRSGSAINRPRPRRPPKTAPSSSRA